MGRGAVNTNLTYIHLFGPLRLTSQPGSVNAIASGIVRDLLSYLLHDQARLFRRDDLAAKFWDRASLEQGRASLSTALWRLNKTLSESSVCALQTRDDLIWIDLFERVELDRDLLRSGLEQARAAARSGETICQDVAERLRRGLEACRGSYLEGCEMDWVLPARETWEAMRLEAKLYLARAAEAQGRNDAAIRRLKSALADDPYDEQLHHDTIRLLIVMGQRSKAILHYEHLATLLSRELGIRPQEKTKALRDNLLAESTATHDKQINQSPKSREGTRFVHKP